MVKRKKKVIQSMEDLVAVGTDINAYSGPIFTTY